MARRSQVPTRSSRPRCRDRARPLTGAPAREDACSLAWTVAIDQLLPGSPERLPEVPRQLRRHLPHRLRLASELRQVVAVVHRPVSQPLARVAHPAHGTNQLNLAHAHVGRHLQPRPLAGHRVPGSLDLHERPAGHRRQAHRSRAKAIRRQRQHRGLLLRESLEHRASVAVAGRCCPSVEPIHQRPADRVEVRACRDRHQLREPHCAATRLHPSLVVSGRRPREARLEEVMTGERLEPRAQLSLAAHDSPHRRAQIVVQQPVGHPAQVGEGPDMSFEKADLILPREEPGEVPAGEHRPQQKQMRLLPLARDVHQHLEEVDLPEVSRPVDQRHEDLLAAALPLPHVVSDQRGSHRESFAAQQLVEPHGRQPLLAARPGRGPREQLLHPADHGVVDRSRPQHPLSDTWGSPLDVSTHRVTGNAHLPGHLPGWHLLDEHLVTNYVNLIHGYHPP